MSDEQTAGKRVRLWWEFEVQITDELALRSAQVDWLRSEDGTLEGVVEWDSIEQQVGVRLMELATLAWTDQAERLGIRFLGGGWPQPRRRSADGGYEPLMLPAMPAWMAEGGEPPSEDRGEGTPEDGGDD